MANVKKINGYDIIDTTSYSTSEIKTGKTWIDGKAIYKKTFTLENLTPDENETTKIIAHNLSIDSLIKIECIGLSSTTCLDFNNYSWTVESTINNCSVLITDEDIVINYDGASYINWITSAYITLYYTK